MSDQQLNDNSVVVQGLEPGYVYQFRVVAVDGEYETASLSQDVHTYGTLPDAADRGGIVLASSGWFIGQSSSQYLNLWLSFIDSSLRKHKDFNVLALA